MTQGRLFEDDGVDLAPPVGFEPSRAEGLRRLRAFTPRAGRVYALRRNFDPGAERRNGVSGLSPYIRRRLVTEQETAAAALAVHGPRGAEKFVQEVIWRTYWKGWLEHRPSVFSRFREDAVRALDCLTPQEVEAHRAAQAGATGIDGFDAWARELDETGYLHNHARMWFASIWIFTLNLPWTLGAALFERKLLDADPASNTLSWRWVAGLQTPGKIYLASADNIERYTEGRFRPKGLAKSAKAIEEDDGAGGGPTTPLTETSSASVRSAAPSGPAVLVLTDEDMNPESLPLGGVDVVAALFWRVPPAQGFEPERAASGFLSGARLDCAKRLAERFPKAQTVFLEGGAQALVDGLNRVMGDTGVSRVLIPSIPVGDVKSALRAASPGLDALGAEVVVLRRTWDETLWPLARRGFFPFKERAWPLLETLAAPRGD